MSVRYFRRFDFLGFLRLKASNNLLYCEFLNAGRVKKSDSIEAENSRGTSVCSLGIAYNYLKIRL